jgi:prolyl-tRNA editing enzyme YbaK/EbsC (Cys-tRNA(Pro) deacylase)
MAVKIASGDDSRGCPPVRVTDIISGRMNEVELLHPTVRSSLENLGIEYEVLPCDPELADTAAFCEHYGVSLEESGNTIIVASKKEPKQYAACLVLATTKLDVNHTVRHLMGAKKLSFANDNETRALTGMAVGGVTVFGLPRNLPLYIDSRVMSLDNVVLGGGNRSCKLKVASKVLENLPGVALVEGLALER